EGDLHRQEAKRRARGVDTATLAGLVRRPPRRAADALARRADWRTHGDRRGRRQRIVHHAPMMHDDGAAAVDERVLIVAPTRRAADVTSSLLRAAGVEPVICADMRELTEQLGVGVGAVLITDQSLAEAGASGFVAAMARQPAWSDVPVLVLTRGREDSSTSV